MLRDDLQNALKTAMLAKDTVTTSAVRMIIAGQKEKDVEARGKGKEKATDEELMAMMQTMRQYLVQAPSRSLISHTTWMQRY